METWSLKNFAVVAYAYSKGVAELISNSDLPQVRAHGLNMMLCFWPERDLGPKKRVFDTFCTISPMREILKFIFCKKETNSDFLTNPAVWAS